MQISRVLFLLIKAGRGEEEEEEEEETGSQTDRVYSERPSFQGGIRRDTWWPQRAWSGYKNGDQAETEGPQRLCLEYE